MEHCKSLLSEIDAWELLDRYDKGYVTDSDISYFMDNMERPNFDNNVV